MSLKERRVCCRWWSAPACFVQSIAPSFHSSGMVGSRSEFFCGALDLRHRQSVKARGLLSPNATARRRTVTVYRRPPRMVGESAGGPISVGDEVEATVTRVTNYGAFMQLPGGLSGLVHISEIADKFIQSVSDHLSVGDTIVVRVLSMDPQRRKISLSIRQSSAAHPTGYDRVVELGGDWGDPWNEDGNTTYMDLSDGYHGVRKPHRWEPDMSLFEPFGKPPVTVTDEYENEKKYDTHPYEDKDEDEDEDEDVHYDSDFDELLSMEMERRRDLFRPKGDSSMDIDIEGEKFFGDDDDHLESWYDEPPPK